MGGMDPEVELQKFLTQIPERSRDAWENLELQGALLDVDEESGKTVSIERLRVKCEEKPDLRNQERDDEAE